MQNTEFITLPIMAKAIQYLPDGSNWDEVIAMVKLNSGHAEVTYVDKNQQPVPPTTVTEHRAILLRVNNHSAVIVTKGNYIILNGDEKYPVPEKDFKAFYIPLSDINQIGNGNHTFADLYKKIAQFEPTLEEILVSDKTVVTQASADVVAFIKSNAYIVTDSDDMNYYVINGNIYILD